MTEQTATPVVDFAAIRDSQGKDVQGPISVLDENHRIVDQQVFDTFTDEDLTDLMQKMLWERTLHDQTTIFSRQGRLGFYAPTIGQEASQIGSVTAFEAMDYLFPTYRDLPQMIQHGAITVEQGFLWSRGHVEGNRIADGVRSWFPQIIIGALHVQAAGAALGMKMNGEPNVAFSYSGDGSTSQGDTYEGLNFAGVYRAPLVMIIQNNGWAISVPRERQTASRTLAQKASAAGAPAVQVDGMDVLAVHAVARAARAYAAAGNGPVLIEQLTYRFGPHSSAGDDPSRYRTHDEEQPWLERDPLNRMRDLLTEKDLWSLEQEAELTEKYKKEFRAAIAAAEKAPKQTVEEFLSNTFEVPTPNIREQIAAAGEREGN
ncbi:thiamine pyrophosphate-dependent enzyme [Brevibacterium sp. 50QC2O2]|jgi:pyruvate dehydrogenase E1 component alpha subunit|uniref:thiamine pyrophosphate-dependent enzyme n=1 Tax=Brevibacterium TaxID=1696 RepID=UPI00211C8C19|nr:MULTISPECIES: thiamine pyrophosphate-dependent enzyme [unclassified Brevibacterium]MCQ9367718.1 thiamine pyrophosphate-dependent enzyme [Brevibacterium sp. 91QC2O2]MCQ9384976.1 thiamine pyrophosphate-dependent enzyme [Brevibacterium sp. 68QC2CO]MCQ9387977.1 thiamine pyrophosphate-dependent enzyme [Brevibacterium sp. 50QC2O2]